MPSQSLLKQKQFSTAEYYSNKNRNEAVIFISIFNQLP
jgi:hypothetical protein